jgi:hypothetical protein
MAGPTSKAGTPVDNDSDVVHGRMAGHWQDRRKPSESNDDNIVFGAVAHCHAVGTTASQSPSTNPTREPIPARNRTEETQAFGPPQRQRKTRATKKCCDCARNATCQSRGARGHHKCSCLLAGRKRTDLPVFGSVKTSPTCFQLLPAIGPKPSSRRQPQVPIQPAISPNLPPVTEPWRLLPQLGRV